MKVEYNNRTVKLPDFFIVGAPRSATTSLYYHLKQNPQIFMPDKKEPNFFAFSEKPTFFKYDKDKPKTIWEFDKYVSLFDLAGEGQIFGEASAIYLKFYKESIKNIKRYIPDSKKLKMIIILRDPAERAFSQYNALRLACIENLKFEDALDRTEERMNNDWDPVFDYIGFSFYYKQVKSYLDNFPHVKICLYDDFKKDTEELVKDVLRFLNAEDLISPNVQIQNRTGVPRSWFLYKLLMKAILADSIYPFNKLIPQEKKAIMVKKLMQKMIKYKKIEMKKETRTKLVNLFRDDILKLQNLLQRDLSGWLEI